MEGPNHSPPRRDSDSASPNSSTSARKEPTAPQSAPGSTTISPTASVKNNGSKTTRERMSTARRPKNRSPATTDSPTHTSNFSPTASPGRHPTPVTTSPTNTDVPRIATTTVRRPISPHCGAQVWESDGSRTAPTTARLPPRTTTNRTSRTTASPGSEAPRTPPAPRTTVLTATSSPDRRKTLLTEQRCRRPRR
jgi:hypothetical protein